jgi:ATP-dependent DNA ligase
MPRTSTRTKLGNSIADGAIPANILKSGFPNLNLPIQPPFPPMEAKSVAELPAGDEWLFEPKWDGFRCLVFRNREAVAMQSKSGQPLDRYFPELLEAFAALPARRFVLDGEIVIIREGRLSFDDLLMRIHPAASRIRKLSRETPATLLAFDLLVDEDGHSLIDLPLHQRQKRLEQFFSKLPRGNKQSSLPQRQSRGGSVRLSPATRYRTQAQRWLAELAGSGFDGLIAKRLDVPYKSGERSGMVKIKRLRSADCVVGGFRWSAKGGDVGSLLLGLYDTDGLLHHVGFTSGFKADSRKKLKSALKPYMGGAGFTGRAPGGPSRWSTERSGEWERLDPKLVCQVQYDHFSEGRFRHGTRFLWWRPDKAPELCTFDQVRPTSSRIDDALAA